MQTETSRSLVELDRGSYYQKWSSDSSDEKETMGYRHIGEEIVVVSIEKSSLSILEVVNAVELACFR